MTKASPRTEQSKKLNKAFFLATSTPDGKVMLQALETHVGRLLKKTPNGVVDPYATTYAIGQHDLVQLIKDRINDGKLAR